MNIHFVGIGGIGLSGLARYMQKKGHSVSGSDIAETKLIEALRKEGIKINIPHSAKYINNQDIVVHTAVAKPDNPELVEAKKRGIKTFSRREFLPYVVNDKKVLSVCGAHGKSTTSSMLASILPKTNAIIGAESKDFGSNMRYTGSDYLVFESDESDGSFIDSNPYIAIVTNTEPEHMEYYNHDLKLFYRHYEEFLKKAKIRVVNADDEFIKTLDFPMKKVSIKDAKNIRYEIIDNKPKTVFEYKNYDFEVYGFGEHLVLDALLAIEAANELITMEEIQKNIKNYHGIKKRFDILQNCENFILIDDYGHHPTEIKATLHSAKIFAKLNGIDKVSVIWQPHKYSRTIDNLDAFIECFNEADELVILPVWEAGEEPVDIDFETLFSKHRPIFAKRIKADSNNIMLINENGNTIKEINEGLVIGFGAGDITYQLRGLI
ncbi:UDP-N-acetylmuramate--alanine ligase [Nautilia profundicola AmH]|uniref:UDP-N-acetylmuramate--L-alanine ligase n=1 Tax=Nautilia profundicola (strain ATCC BAA-1463 / DSM 18972 / AmH) TaxID=598659 RepID=B9L9F6_NAUPA|nr:UDP-N-acetylmuramate--L-alanine ligase [Nautilia profundicola]ACM93378.1 UDP-N-acetylmuramate--alanine ligase [Nautilia profundicola AmH]